MVEEDEKDLLNRALADVIKGARNTEGLTQKQLAERAGVNYETFKNIEKAQHKISVVQVALIAEAVHLPPQTLVIMAMSRYEELVRRAKDEGLFAGMSEGSTTSSTEDPRTMSAAELDQIDKKDVDLAAHPKTPESEQDEQF